MLTRIIYHVNRPHTIISAHNASAYRKPYRKKKVKVFIFAISTRELIEREENLRFEGLESTF
jgi:hypothetical protein